MNKKQNISLETPVTVLPGISTVREKSFAKLEIRELGELINHFPRGYQNRKNVVALKDAPLDVPVSLVLTVATDPKSFKLRSNFSMTKFKAFDESGSAEVIFYNRPYVDKSYVRGTTHRFWGKLTRDKTVLRLSSPESEPCFEGAKLLPMMPVYPLCAGLTQKIVSSSVRHALDLLFLNTSETGADVKDPIPGETRKKYRLCTRAFAYENIHFPSDEETLRLAGRRLAFEELFLLSVKLNYAKKLREYDKAHAMKDIDLGSFLKILPYELTSAQMAVVKDICADMSRIKPMSRLVSGDVGSGKTVCAAAAAYIAAKNGCQIALMAPTEILARQHYAELSKLFEKLGFGVCLLVGATKKSEKTKIYEKLKSGEVELVIGTHALLSDNVEFKKLALVITDEQHRFGVRQRALLGQKALGVHVLVMSATPIPRTLALILYGDLDVSQICEMPPGRQKVDTFVVNESYRERLNAFIKKQVDGGHRVYIVCPTVEESEPEVEEEADLLISDFFDMSEKEEKLPLKSTVEYARHLKEEIFPDLKVGYIHGKMKSSEKEAAMSAFVNGETQILVSTTVIEVGVNVPEATLMIVENAERFGLSQLHQLRGRVGRGRDKSYCILVSDCKFGSKSAKRLEVMRTTSDGYTISERDLAERGPGDFVGMRDDLKQHGKFNLKFAEYADTALIMDASSAASEIIENDSELENTENSALKEVLGKLLREGTAFVN